MDARPLPCKLVIAVGVVGVDVGEVVGDAVGAAVGANVGVCAGDGVGVTHSDFYPTQAKVTVTTSGGCVPPISEPRTVRGQKGAATNIDGRSIRINSSHVACC